MNNLNKAMLDHVIDKLDECIDGGGDTPAYLDREHTREILEDFIALYNSGKVAA